MIQLAVVGLGAWGPNLLRNAIARPEVEVKVICDLDRRRVERFCRLYPGVSGTTKFEKILKDKEVHAVLLATPAGLHADHARQLLEAGKHVLVEKPVALNVADAESIHSLAAEKGLVVMAGHTFIFNAAVRKMKELLQRKEIGRPLFVLSRRMSLGQVREDVNVLWNLCPHDVSILCHLFGGEPLWVQANGAAFLQKKHADLVLLTMEFPGGILAHVEANWLNPVKMREMILVGDRKMILYDDVKAEGKIAIYDSGFDVTPAPLEEGSFGAFQLQIRRGDVLIPQFDFPEPLGLEIAEFAGAIRDHRPPLTGGEHFITVTRVLEAAQKSIDNHSERVMV